MGVYGPGTITEHIIRDIRQAMSNRVPGANPTG